MSWKEIWKVETIGKYLKEQPYIVELDNNDKKELKDTDEEIILIKKLKEIYKSQKLENEDLKEQVTLLENRKIEIIDTNNIGKNAMVFSTLMSFLAISVSVINGFSSLTSNENVANSNNIKKLVFYLIVALIFFGSLFLMHILEKSDKQTQEINTKKRIAINVQKSVIEEMLETNKLSDDLKEIQKTLDGTLRETETLGRIFETKANM